MRCTVETAAPVEIVRRSTSLTLRAVAPQDTAIAVVDHHKPIVAIAIAVGRIADQERSRRARFVVIITIPATNWFRIAVIAIIGSPDRKSTV